MKSTATYALIEIIKGISVHASFAIADVHDLSLYSNCTHTVSLFWLAEYGNAEQSLTFEGLSYSILGVHPDQTSAGYAILYLQVER